MKSIFEELNVNEQFTEEEVKLLCAKSKNVSFKEIDECYDSYLSDTNIKLYDPHSVIFALENN